MKWRINSWFPDISKAKVQQLRTYFDLIIQWNKVVNLVSPQTIGDMDRIHMADSIQGSQIIVDYLTTLDIQTSQIADLGSGNGYPGVVFAILYPQYKVVSVEIDQKKASFLTQVKIKLGLPNFMVINKKIEEVSAEICGVSMSRAVGEVSKILDMLGSQPVQTSQSDQKHHVFHFKGPSGAQELDTLDNQKRSTWNNLVIREYSLPVQGEILGIQSVQESEKRMIMLSIEK